MAKTKTNIAPKKAKPAPKKKVVAEVVEIEAKKVKNRADNRLKQQRLDYVLGMVVSGLRQSKIIEIINAKKTDPKFKIDFNIEDSGIKEYIRAAHKTILKKSHSTDYYYKRAIRRKDELYAMSKQLQDLKTCNAIDDSLNKLLGFDKQTVEHKATNQIMFGDIPVSPETLAKLDYEED